MAPTKDSKKKRTYCTPLGSALFVHVVEPDYGTEKFPVKEGQFSLTLILDADATAILKSKLKDDLEDAREYAQEEFGKLKRATREKLGDLTFNALCEPEYDKDDEPTGNYRWKFKTGAFLKDKTTGKKRARSVPVFDSMNQRVTLKEEPGNGSAVCVSFTTAPYFVEGQGMGGLSLFLNALQVVRLNKHGERSASDYGFAASEEGFTASDMEDDTDTETGSMHCGPDGCHYEARPSESSDIPDDVDF